MVDEVQDIVDSPFRVREKAFRVIVVGAGVAGLAAAVKLERAGITDFAVLEKADRVGGTWRDNTYPGCGVDIPSALYSFSFNPNPGWTRLYASQSEILGYLEDTVVKFDLRRYLHLRTEMIEAAWSEHRRRWMVETTRGTYVAQYIVLATGPINEPSIPPVDGLADFPGEVFHSARWDHEVELTGKRVAVIGTGASVAQFVPEIQPKVARLHIFQRTAPWVFPRLDLPIPAITRSMFRYLPIAQYGLRMAADVGHRAYTMLMRRGYTAQLLGPASSCWLAWHVPDAELRAALTPSYTVGCKRVLLSNTYLAALTRPNVELLPQEFAGVSGRQVIARDGARREVDVIIFGTGFDVIDLPIASRVRGRDGTLLADRWGGSPEAYLCTTVPGLPNAFVLLGPNILIYNSFIGLAESQLGYVTDALVKAERANVEVLEVRDEPFRAFNDKLQAELSRTVLNTGGCVSFYHDRNGKNFAAWPWSTGSMRRAHARFDLKNYTTQGYRGPGDGIPPTTAPLPGEFARY